MYKTIVNIDYMANISVHTCKPPHFALVLCLVQTYNTMVMLSSLVVVVLVEVSLINTAHYCYLSKFKTNKNTISKLDIIPNLEWIYDMYLLGYAWNASKLHPLNDPRINNMISVIGLLDHRDNFIAMFTWKQHLPLNPVENNKIDDCSISCVLSNFSPSIHLSDEENKKVYGKCNNPNGHGHNYKG